MPLNVDLYLLSKSSADSLGFICRLIAKAYDHQHRLYIHTASDVMAKRLDEQLWTYQAERFMPHMIYPGAAHMTSPETDTPIYLGWQNDIPFERDVLLNLAPEVPNFFQSFVRVLDIVSNETDRRAQGRARYRTYQAHGCTINTHQL